MARTHFPIQQRVPDGQMEEVRQKEHSCIGGTGWWFGGKEKSGVAVTMMGCWRRRTVPRRRGGRTRRTALIQKGRCWCSCETIKGEECIVVMDVWSNFDAFWRIIDRDDGCPRCWKRRIDCQSKPKKGMWKKYDASNLERINNEMRRRGRDVNDDDYEDVVRTGEIVWIELNWNVMCQKYISALKYNCMGVPCTSHLQCSFNLIFVLFLKISFQLLKSGLIIGRERNLIWSNFSCSNSELENWRLYRPSLHYWKHSRVDLKRWNMYTLVLLRRDFFMYSFLNVHFIRCKYFIRVLLRYTRSAWLSKYDLKLHECCDGMEFYGSRRRMLLIWIPNRRSVKSDSSKRNTNTKKRVKWFMCK